MSGITKITGFAHLHDLPCYQLQFAEASVVVSAYGGQVLSYQPTPGQELLWLSPLAVWHQQQPIRGGVPVCWPWFGPVDSQLNPQQQRLPNHGLVRTQLWTLLQHNVTADYCQLCLSICVDDLPYLPENTLPADVLPENALPKHAVELSLTVTLTAHDLSITLSCNEPILQQAALHSYFQVSDVPQTQVIGIGEQYRDKVQQNLLVTAESPLIFDREIDRVYTQPLAKLALQSSQHTIAIEQQGFDSTIVWNPWVERCAAISDLANNSYQHFVCVESARLSLTTKTPLQLTQRLSRQ